MCCLRAAAGVLPPPLRFFLFWVGDDVFVGNVAAAASCGADERRRAFQHRLLSPRCSGPRHVAGLVPMCVVRCMYACRRSCPRVSFPRVFPESVFRVCFPRVFSFFLLLFFLGGVASNCLSMAFASRWPLPLDGLCLLMVSRWPFDGLSMASRWPLDGLSMGCLTSPSPSSTTLAEGSRCGKKDQQGACAWRGGGKTGESGSPKLPRSLFAPSLRSPRP